MMLQELRRLLQEERDDYKDFICSNNEVLLGCIYGETTELKVAYRNPYNKEIEGPALEFYSKTFITIAIEIKISLKILHFNRNKQNR